MQHIQLVALDLDGTLFNEEKEISEYNKEIIRRAIAAGVTVVISTGRPYCGLPFAQMEGLGIDYAITANGGGIFHLPTKTCIKDSSMEPAVAYPIIDYLLTKNIHFDVFSNGYGFSDKRCIALVDKTPLIQALTNYIKSTRTIVEDMASYARDHALNVSKITCNFPMDEDGNMPEREEVKAALESNPAVTCVCGGYSNLEFTARGVTKGAALRELADILQIPVAATMAIGDTENDITILEAAGVAVAMGNATEDVKAVADYITTSNEEDGVAHAMEHYLGF